MAHHNVNFCFTTIFNISYTQSRVKKETMRESMEGIATCVNDIQIPIKRFIQNKKNELTSEYMYSLTENSSLLEVDMMSDIIHEPPTTEFKFRSETVLEYYNDRYIDWVENTDRVLNQLKNNKKAHFNDLLNITKDILTCYTNAPFYILNLTNRRVPAESDLYIAYHSVNVAILSIAVGIQAEYGSYQIIELGIGALLHDLGHKKSNQELMTEEYLDDDEREAYNTHVTTGIHLLKNLTHIPITTALIILQHHEYYDGSGRINQTPPERIHDFSSIIHIVDTFESRCRFHSPNLSLTFFIKDSKLGIFNKKFLSTFVTTLSLFPIGTFVLTEKSEIGKVIGTRRGTLQNPIIVTIFSIENGSLKPLKEKRLFNTTQDNQVKIIKTFNNAQLNRKISLGF